MDPITLSGLVFTGVIATALTKLHLTKVRVPRVGEWLLPPQILLTRSCPVERVLVDEAAEVWRELGHEIGPVRIQTSTPTPPQITITLKPSGIQDRRTAFARVTQKRGFIESAVIFLPNFHHGKENGDAFTPDEVKLIIAHEIGHALGFQDVETPLLGRRKGRPILGLKSERSGHLMHSKTSRLGWSLKGLKSRV